MQAQTCYPKYKYDSLTMIIPQWSRLLSPDKLYRVLSQQHSYFRQDIMYQVRMLCPIEFLWDTSSITNRVKTRFSDMYYWLTDDSIVDGVIYSYFRGKQQSYLQVIVWLLRYYLANWQLTPVFIPSLFPLPQPFCFEKFWKGDSKTILLQFCSLFLVIIAMANSDNVQRRLRGPALVQHRDGRLFAVNAHLKPGQLFRSLRIWKSKIRYWFISFFENRILNI